LFNGSDDITIVWTARGAAIPVSPPYYLLLAASCKNKLVMSCWVL